MARGIQGVMMRGFGARDHQATVVSTEAITPNLLRLRMVSPTLFEDAVAEPTSWLRFWFPDPAGSKTEFQRAYTMSEMSPETGEFAIDVVLHEPAGPASRWARSAKPGDAIAVMTLGSAGFSVPEDPPAGYLLIGDAAATPAINGIIGVVPHDIPIEVYLEEHDENDRLIPIAEHPRMRVHWVVREDATSLAGAIEARDWSNWYCWVTPEAGSLKHLRTRLRDEFGFPKAELHPQAYWTEGRAMGTKRGDDDKTPEVNPAPRADKPEDRKSVV